MEGNHEADVAPSEYEFDTSAIEYMTEVLHVSMALAYWWSGRGIYWDEGTEGETAGSLEMKHSFWTHTSELLLGLSFVFYEMEIMFV